MNASMRGLGLLRPQSVNTYEQFKGPQGPETTGAGVLCKSVNVKVPAYKLQGRHTDPFLIPIPIVEINKDSITDEDVKARTLHGRNVVPPRLTLCVKSR